MTLLHRTMAMILVTVLAGACGGSGTPGTGASGSPTTGHNMSGTCSPTGELELEAENTAFDKTCLATKAATATTLRFKNRDGGTPHNMNVFRDAAATQSVFKGELVDAKTEKTYTIPALAKGTYHFHCDVHPGIMQGTFIAA